MEIRSKCLTDDGTYTYEYDCEHRLVKVKEGETTVAAFEYDALGRRVKKTVGDDVTRYIYDGQNVIEEYAWNGGTSTWDLDGKYVHGIGVDDVLTVELTDGMDNRTSAVAYDDKTGASK